MAMFVALEACLHVLHPCQAGLQTHIGQPEHLHMTVFMTSHPFDVREDAFAAIPADHARCRNAEHAQGNADRERSAVANVTAGAQAPIFQVAMLTRLG